MRDIPLEMTRNTMNGLSDYDFPEGFTIRRYTPGAEAEWTRIEMAVNGFERESDALAYFQEVFGPASDRLPGRMLFLQDDTGRSIGTITAWFGVYAGVTQGRIHWVAIVPEFQGRGLARPLLAAAMALLAADFDRAYLTTETTSYRGISLYLSFGFAPVVESELDREGWKIVEEALGRTVVS